MGDDMGGEEESDSDDEGTWEAYNLNSNCKSYIFGMKKLLSLFMKLDDTFRVLV